MLRKNGFSLLNGVASGGGFGTYQERRCLEKRIFASQDSVTIAFGESPTPQQCSSELGIVFGSIGDFGKAQTNLALRSLLQNLASQDSVTTRQSSNEFGFALAAPESRFAGFCHDSAKLKRVWLCARCSRICPLLNGVASGDGLGTYQGAWEGDRKGDAQQASPFLHIEFRMTFGTNYQRLYWFFFSSRSSAGISGASGSLLPWSSPP